MIKLTFTTTLPLAILLTLGNPSRIRASGDTPVTVKDGGSILLVAGGLDGGTTWKVGRLELRHVDSTGTLSAVQITEAGADRCSGDPKCGIDPSKKWTIQVNYGSASLTLASVSGNKGAHVKFGRNIAFTDWQKTANPDEREFGHGDGNKITGIAVNNGPNLCAGKDGCQITIVYTTP
jgi:hypothetical protein